MLICCLVILGFFLINLYKEIDEVSYAILVLFGITACLYYGKIWKKSCEFILSDPQLSRTTQGCPQL